MSAAFLKDIDWERPWLSSLRSIAQPILQSADWRAALNTAATPLKNHRGLPIRFVPQAELPSGTPYEAFISGTGQVPTRDNLHDFFNALVWLAFPKIKSQLNACQAAEIARMSNAATDLSLSMSNRGRVRDAATIFDENAALIITRDPELVEALRNHEWRHVFIGRREAFLQDYDVWLFGHALMEKLELPYKGITAHAWTVEADNTFFILSPMEKRIWVDEQVSKQLAYGLSTSSFTPLPVLGLPGWWGSQEESFYSDTKVFRPKRASKK